MPSLLQRRYSNYETFRRFEPGLLLTWLRRSEVYLAKRGVLLPRSREQGAGSAEVGRGGESSVISGQLSVGSEARPHPFLLPQERGIGIDYEGLVRVFMEPTEDMPADLADGLHVVHEMGTPRRLDSMLREARENDLELGLPESATPLDVALKLWLMDPGMLENLLNSQDATRQRKFEYFSTNASPVPAFHGASLEQLRRVEERMEAFYQATWRGSGTRVFSYCQQRKWQRSAEWLFVVRHGEPFQREEAMANGEPTSVLFRPRKCAVLKYDTGRGEMGVYSRTAQEQRVLLRVFGSCLFGRADFFPQTKKIDLRPLVELGRGSVACADVPGIARVQLTDVEVWERRDPWKRYTMEADDIFQLVENGDFKWPKNVQDITRATFQVLFWHEKRPRRVTIVPCNRALYSRDEDWTLMERLMLARGLIKN